MRTSGGRDEKIHFVAALAGIGGLNRNQWLGAGIGGLGQESVAWHRNRWLGTGIEGLEQELVAWSRNEWPEQESVAYAGIDGVLKNDLPLAQE